MKNYRLICTVIAAAAVAALVLLPSCTRTSGSGRGSIILATTTSTYDSGLLRFILPVFTEKTGWRVDVVSVGSGAALQLGRDGQADVLLVHSIAAEFQFVADGHGLERFDVMYNDFIIVGPEGYITPNSDINKTLSAIAEQNLPFVSRGDNSGTHVMELDLWRKSGINPAILSNYFSVGQGMGAALQMANELKAFTLTDRATWLSQLRQRNLTLVIICEKDSALLNYYGVIAVNPGKTRRTFGSQINAQGAQDFVNWMLLPSTQSLIGSYGMEEFGEPLFTPNAR